MGMELVNIGFGCYVAANRIVSIIEPDSAPVKRMVSDARERGTLIDATYGRRTRAVLVTDSGHLVLSATQSETIAARVSGTGDKEETRKGGE